MNVMVQIMDVNMSVSILLEDTHALAELAMSYIRMSGDVKMLVLMMARLIVHGTTPKILATTPAIVLHSRDARPGGMLS